MDAIYQKLVKINDDYTASTLGRQILDPNSKYVGGVIDETGIARANHMSTPSIMACWASALVNPDSRYYHDEKLLTAFEMAADFILNRQHADGTVSLGSTNYNSPPDTAFVVGGVTQFYQLLEAHDWAAVKPAAAKLKLFLERTIPAMLTGGCHTPNHRWVITAALALLYEIFPMPELVARADEWLAEGMDITEDGEWTERSNGIYNAVSDIALYHTAKLFNRPDLLDGVRRNLNMMVYLIHPSGEVVTDYSGRQDFGETYDMATYFLIYRLMAAHDRNPLFAAMSDYAGTFIRKSEAVNNHALLGMLLYPETAIEDLERAELPERYTLMLNEKHPMEKHLKQIDRVGHHMKIQHSSMHVAFGAPIVRIRDREQSVTIMPLAPSFFSLRHGKVRLLGMKLSTSFSPGIIKFNHLTAAESGYKLNIVMEKGYNGPIPQPFLPEAAQQGQVSPWYLLPHQHRPMTHLQTHEIQAEIVQGDSEWQIRIHSDAREDVFTQLSFILGDEGQVSGEDLADAGDGKYFLKSGGMRYEAEGDAIEISSGAYEHFLPALREDQHPIGCRYVHVNLVTPFDRTFTIRLR
ncbi:hypothetical protein GCM10008018_55360 [Paenibacillus marchantiophytorum]|uniref:Heparinase II/III-like protein n=1 Tax=Paenibacillus marchantiophytorum TaxID=1619310 RepID=A0ABQ1F884_9BACL|nr:hypothetical protein [Paenibacillus marchantiophytorum]GGA02088.1 hypothetical protein GCM10008018_55360 [Paenibacillus marchantiophytorum]